MEYDYTGSRCGNCDVKTEEMILKSEVWIWFFMILFVKNEIG
jgi:hypothetical protein